MTNHDCNIKNNRHSAVEYKNIALWPEGVPGEAEKKVAYHQPPSLTIYPCSLAPAARGTVLVLPGGGYQHLADHEGETVALQLNKKGFHAAVLEYRLAPGYKHPAMIHDAQRGVRMLKAHGKQWGVAPESIAALGFSAGGHLASSLAVHYHKFTCDKDDLAGQFSARPSCAVLCYPVIDMSGRFGHSGSCKNLLGNDPDPQLADLLSTDQQVNENIPPTFLWHTADDPAVSVENSLAFAKACHDHKVPVELHVYESGPHGLGLATDNPPVNGWFDCAAGFLNRHL